MRRNAVALRATVERERGTVTARQLIEDYLEPTTARSLNGRA
jgi:hypothetical protein